MLGAAHWLPAMAWQLLPPAQGLVLLAPAGCRCETLLPAALVLPTCRLVLRLFVPPYQCCHPCIPPELQLCADQDAARRSLKLFESSPAPALHFHRGFNDVLRCVGCPLSES